VDLKVQKEIQKEKYRNEIKEITENIFAANPDPTPALGPTF